MKPQNPTLDLWASILTMSILLLLSSCKQRQHGDSPSVNVKENKVNAEMLGPLNICLWCRSATEVHRYEDSLRSLRIFPTFGEVNKAKDRSISYSTLISSDTARLRKTPKVDDPYIYFETYLRPQSSDSAPFEYVQYEFGMRELDLADQSPNLDNYYVRNVFIKYFYHDPVLEQYVSDSLRPSHSQGWKNLPADQQNLQTQIELSLKLYAPQRGFPKHNRYFWNEYGRFRFERGVYAIPSPGLAGMPPKESPSLEAREYLKALIDEVPDRDQYVCQNWQFESKERTRDWKPYAVELCLGWAANSEYYLRPEGGDSATHYRYVIESKDFALDIRIFYHED